LASLAHKDSVIISLDNEIKDLQAKIAELEVQLNQK
jgi:hypothetical protein